MLSFSEWQEPMLYHPLLPAGPVPTVEDPEGIYPYESFCETSKRPVLRSFRMVSIENSRMRVTVCPDLGGKVHSILDKSSGKEVLFDAGAVRPVRILPRMAFISGGIEVSFPIAHTPVQIEPVHAVVEQVDDRLYLWCGEREVRYGMQWTVEYSLGPDDAYLTQRTTFHNPSSRAHAWMSWSNAALPARPDSQFHFPSGRVLRHADILEETDWDGMRDHRLADFDRMQGYFWKTADCHAFGMYTPSLGSGLYHIADPAETPGIKLWLYGIGAHEEWARQTSVRRESYVEIQAGPILDQAGNNTLGPGENHLHTEFWIPAACPLNIRELQLPNPALIQRHRIPLFDWYPRSSTVPWLQLEEACRLGDSAHIPNPPGAEECLWPPSGMERLGDALKWAALCGRKKDQALWTYYLGVWLAGCGQVDQSLEILRTVNIDASRALQGRLLRTAKGDFEAAREAYRIIASAAWALHPQVFVERDITLSRFGLSTLQEREKWFEQADSLQDDAILERKASFLLDKGALLEARELLEKTEFEKVHQRYERSGLWARIAAALEGTDSRVPANLGEDDLAAFGAYRVSGQGE